jgi:hypothetical protein
MRLGILHRCGSLIQSAALSVACVNLRAASNADCRGEMTDLAHAGFTTWNQAYPSGVHSGESVVLRPGSVFLHESVLLHGSGAGSVRMGLVRFATPFGRVSVVRRVA